MSEISLPAPRRWTTVLRRLAVSRSAEDPHRKPTASHRDEDRHHKQQLRQRPVYLEQAGMARAMEHP